MISVSPLSFCVFKGQGGKSGEIQDLNSKSFIVWIFFKIKYFKYFQIKLKMGGEELFVVSST